MFFTKKALLTEDQLLVSPLAVVCSPVKFFVGGEMFKRKK